MICFHFTIFVVLETTRLRRRTHRGKVVICFHFTIFVVLETTILQQPALDAALWFAFILLSLSYWKQRQLRSQIWVVPLWFAFILLSLSYWKQRMKSYEAEGTGCDLLSFYYLCRTGNNMAGGAQRSRPVVICFHFTIFVVLETTSHTIKNFMTTLWFAFILLSLSYWKQLPASSMSSGMGCDLLSFYYLCRTGNNLEVGDDGGHPLWFAFILLSLSYWKQPPMCRYESTTCCDLLSFYYLCRTGNNCGCGMQGSRKVVICFHFTIFVVLETTIFKNSKAE